MVTTGNAASTIGVPNIPGDQQEGVDLERITGQLQGHLWGYLEATPGSLGCRNIEGGGTPLDSKNI